MSQSRPARFVLICGASLAFACVTLSADEAMNVREELRQLRERNQALEQQLQQQHSLIEALSRKVDEIQEARTSSRDLPELSQNPEEKPDRNAPTAASVFGRLNLSGEGGVALLHSGPNGMFPNSEFRIDEARLFVEAPVFDNVFFFGELTLATREQPDVQARLGEVYVDFENVSRLWNHDRLLNVRLGRMYVPFGEEYLTRYAIDNPFVSHSLSDLWGVDEGLEIYGRAGRVSYVAAVQNGGLPDTSDFTRDKSLAGKIGFHPLPQLHLSLSGMRTGTLDSRQDQFSAMWFGGGFFRSLSSVATTRFQAELVQADVQLRLPHGHLSAFGGYIRYHDDDRGAANGRDVYYYSLEGVYDIIGKLYGGVRFSQILAERGFPIVGNGDFGDYFFGPLTKDIWRLSLDLGYRWSDNLLFKAEYTFERGSTVGDGSRNNEDLFALEAAFKF